MVAQLLRAVAVDHGGHRQEDGEGHAQGGRPFRRLNRSPPNRDGEKPQRERRENQDAGDEHLEETVVQGEPIIDQKRIEKDDASTRLDLHGGEPRVLGFGREHGLDGWCEIQPSFRGRNLPIDVGEPDVRWGMLRHGVSCDLNDHDTIPALR